MLKKITKKEFIKAMTNNVISLLINHIESNSSILDGLDKLIFNLEHLTSNIKELDNRVCCYSSERKLTFINSNNKKSNLLLDQFGSYSFYELKTDGQTYYIVCLYVDNSNNRYVSTDDIYTRFTVYVVK